MKLFFNGIRILSFYNSEKIIFLYEKKLNSLLLEDGSELLLEDGTTLDLEQYTHDLLTLLIKEDLNE